MRVVPIISIHDDLLGYKSVFIEQNTSTAVRGFTNSICRILDEDQYTDFNVHDLRLYHVGDFNLDSGEITSFPPKLLISGADIYSAWYIENSHTGEDPFEA